MSSEPTAFGLDSNKLGELLRICASKDATEDNMTENQQRDELLQDRLSESLLTGSLKNSPLRKELTDICRMSGILAGESIRELLNDPNSDIDLVRKIKEHGKRLSQAAADDLEQDTANVIYYAAIAHALIFHDTKITNFSYADLQQSFSSLRNIEWVSSDLTDIFLRAGKYCQANYKKKKRSTKGE